METRKAERVWDGVLGEEAASPSHHLRCRLTLIIATSYYGNYYCILGVTVNELLSAADHVSSLLASSSSLLYALRVLRVHGIPDESLQEVVRATLLAKITYAGLAWHGMCSAGDIAKLESLVK